VNYKLRDWVYSRQHYWGEPIPIIHCAKCGAVAVPEKDLPVELPKVDHYEPTDDGESPLSRIPEFVNVECPKCGAPAKRETDTMPNWAGSNWYYLRYFDAKNDAKFADADKLKYWGEVDLYLGGMEHTTLHLLYSRFHHQFLYDQKLVPTPEPYAARRGQGIVLAADGRKMSKSLGNVVDPTAIIESGYGADAARLAVAFLAPYDQTTPWSPETVVGCYKFLAKVWNLAQADFGAKSSPETLRVINKTVKKVGEDIDKMNFNVAIAALMECVNDLNKIGISRIAAQDFAKFVQILAPFAPHLAEEIWREVLGRENSIHLSEFPLADEKYLAQTEVRIAVQVNGKLRGEISAPADETRENIEKLALEQENVAKFIGDKKPAKIIYVAGKIVNIVVKQ
jgi:leucyl-tRNA synthetase